MVMSVNRDNCGLSAEIITGLILRWGQLKVNKLTASSIAPSFGWCVADRLSLELVDCRRRRTLQRINREKSQIAREKIPYREN
jgi:hypothetical protein